MKCISWNVNGIRAVIKKGFLDIFDEFNADIVALQEVKSTQEEAQISFDMATKGYKIFWNSAMKKGYSGTAIFSRVEPISVKYDLGIEEHDQEGRVITLEYDTFFFVNVYTPNSKRELLRLEYRQQWDKDFLQHLQNLEKSKPVIICGDLNVAHKEIDLENPGANKRNAGFTIEEREGIQNALDVGFVDTFRFLYPTQTKSYTWWSNFANSRARNIGWRIDYFLVSSVLKSHITEVQHLSDIMGSDHCPVGLEITL